GAVGWTLEECCPWQEAGVRDPETRRDSSALRSAAGAGRRDEELGGAQGTGRGSEYQEPRDAGGGPPDRIQDVRGNDPARRVRRRHRDALGSRVVRSGKRRRRGG